MLRSVKNIADSVLIKPVVVETAIDGIFLKIIDLGSQFLIKKY